MEKKEAKLKYALDADGKLVHIDNVPNGSDCNCFCPCGRCGQKMVAKNDGKKKTHHFAYHPGGSCEGAYETMLHLLAKEKIQKEFYSSQHFKIEYRVKSYCKNMDECKSPERYDCHVTELIPFDLKEHYDSCEQEIKYDGINRRSDLKIFSSEHPERKPVYIEFFVTHASDDEKLHSGNRIIEAKISSEDDIYKMLNEGIVETEIDDDYLYPDKPKQSFIKFYGFKKENHEVCLERNIAISRFVLWPSGKMHCNNSFANCRVVTKERPDSLLEICFSAYSNANLFNMAKYVAYREKQVMNCSLCKYYVKRLQDLKNYCCLYKDIFNSRYEHNTALAQMCKSFCVDEEEMQKQLKRFGELPKDEYQIFIK